MSKPARKPVRDDMRPALRASEFRGRDGEILTRSDGNTLLSNQFELPEHLNEDGWSRQWVRTSCFGKDDPANVAAHYAQGWRPVPAETRGFREHFRIEGGTNQVERDGQLLMERPQGLTDAAHREDYRAAMIQRNEQVEEFALSDLPAGFDRSYGKWAKKEGIKRGDPVRVDDPALYPSRELATLGDD